MRPVAFATRSLPAGAVVASGTFVATGQNKLVQHLEGGILRELLVGEGDEVARGQVLVKIDDTAAKAKLRRLVLKKYRLAIMQARLLKISGVFDFAPARPLFPRYDVEWPSGLAGVAAARVEEQLGISISRWCY